MRIKNLTWKSKQRKSNEIKIERIPTSSESIKHIQVMVQNYNRVVFVLNFGSHLLTYVRNMFLTMLLADPNYLGYVYIY
jgi:hypothetical protein